MQKKMVTWSPEARADLRAIDRETALRILRAIDGYLTTGAGDVKKLQPPRTEFRLRVGDYRVLFAAKQGLTIEILRVLHRKDAYR
jgi:mRNA-degrading endonuclease RelE of RelBE toxin-antitoxin system